MQLQLPTSRSKDEWQVYIWNLADDYVSRPQKLQFMLMIESPFNEFDPFQIVADLLKHRGDWRGVVMDGNMVKLGQIAFGSWAEDTLYILTQADRGTWEKITSTWKADTVEFIEGEAVCDLIGMWPNDNGLRVVMLWWD